jgi:hypothetical protein
MVTLRVTALIGLALLALLSACSGGDDDDDGSISESAPTVASDESEDKPRAQDLLLTVDDLPVGWIDRGAQAEDGQDFDLNCGPAAFKNGDFSISDPLMTDAAESGVFANGDDVAVVSAAYIFESSTDAQAFMTSYQEGLNGCRAELQESLETALYEDTRDEGYQDIDVNVEVGDMSFTQFGDDSHAYRIKYGVAVPSSQFEGTWDMFVVRTHYAVARVNYIASGDPSHQSQEALIQTATDKASQAISGATQ